MTTSNEQPVLSLNDVSLSYLHSRRLFGSQKIPVLNNINLELYRGQTLGIIGRNGAGKSSMLRLLAGIIAPDSGQVKLHSPELRISLLSLQLGFQVELTGRENAILGCLLMGLPRVEAENLMQEIIEFSGLAAAIEDPLSTYSSGMRARLGFSVALYSQADIMLVDEVLGVGDYEFKLKSRDALISLTASNRTAVLVSHDENYLAEVCDELLWLEQGRLVMHGLPHTVLEVYHDYDHMISSLADYLGITVEEARADPNNQDPIQTISRLKQSIKLEREEELGWDQDRSNPVRTWHPMRFGRLSQLVEQHCRGSCWVENTRVIASGDNARIAELYHQYEDLLLAISKTTKTDIRLVRDTRLVRELVKLIELVGGGTDAANLP